MRVTDAIEAIGLGRFQAKHLCCAWATGAVLSSNVMLMYYVSIPPQVACDGVGACAGRQPPTTQELCDQRALADEGWHFAGSSVQREWNLECTDEWLIPVSQSVFFFGWFVASVFAGQVSDNHGRRVPLTIALLLLASSCFLCGKATTPHLYIAAKFLHGACVGATLLYTYVYGYELLPPSRASFFGTTYFTVAAVGSGLTAVLAYTLKGDWRAICSAVAGVTYPMALWPHWAPESPRWLVAADMDGALKALRVMAGDRWRAPNMLEVEDECDKEKKAPVRILCDTTHRGTMLKLMICWFCSALCYFGLGLGGATLPGDDYVNGALLSAVEVPVYVFLQLALTYLGNRVTMIGSCCGAAVCCYTFLVLPLAVAKWCSFGGQMLVTASFTVIYIWTSELVSAHIRATVMGLCTAAGKLGSMVAPYAVLLAGDELTLAMCIYGCVLLVAASTSCMLPESHVQPDAVDEEKELLPCQA